MSRKWVVHQGGTWTDIDLATNHETIISNTQAIADQETADALAYATAAQGDTADTALQPADVGTAAAEDVGYFATAAQGSLTDLMALAIAGDMVFKCTPTTAGSSAAAINADIDDAEASNKFVRTVVVTLETAAGAVHTWYAGDRDAAAVASSNLSEACAITGGATAITFASGTATVLIDYTGAWVANDTCTLTVTAGTLLGYTLVDKTSVDTVIA